MNDRLPWFRCVPSALLGALAGMPADEGYTYVAILLRIYETGGPVAETPRTLARRTGLSERRVMEALCGLVKSGKVVAENGHLDSPTTHEEIAWQNERREEQIVAGKTSAKKRAVKTQQNQQNQPTPVERPFNHLDLDKEEDKIEGDGDDGRARDACEISREAFSISEKLIALFLFDPDFVPPGWCGAPRWIQKCLNEGIPADVIISSAEGVKGRKRDGPPESFLYLEKPLARDWARQQTPLPVVNIKPEVINETARPSRGGTSPLTAAVDKFIAAGERQEREAIDGGEIREIAPRMLSHRRG